MPDHVQQFADLRSAAEGSSPLHGFRGDLDQADRPFLPAGLTIAISREAGSRGTSIGKCAGEKLGWQTYTQEMLEYLAQEETARREVTSALGPPAAHWVERQCQRFQSSGPVGGDMSTLNMARLILALGAVGEVVMIGRGAGYLLPRQTTLHVRLIAPLEDRIAYMGQWQRLTREEAAKQVALKDSRRSEYLKTHFHRDVADVYQYDLLLNTTLLGEELAADLLVQAARAKSTMLLATGGAC